MTDSLRDCIALARALLSVGAGCSQFEECIGDLKHQDMWVAESSQSRVRGVVVSQMSLLVFVTDQDAFARPAHAMLLVVLLQSPQSIFDRRVFLWLRLFCAEGVITDRRP